MEKKETILDSPLLIENKNGGIVEEEEAIRDYENLSVIFEMATELREIGLSDKAISRQLNINYHRR